MLDNGIEKVRGSTPLISTTMKAHQARLIKGFGAFLVFRGHFRFGHGRGRRIEQGRDCNPRAEIFGIITEMVLEKAKDVPTESRVVLGIGSPKESRTPLPSMKSSCPSR